MIGLTPISCGTTHSHRRTFAKKIKASRPSTSSSPILRTGVSLGSDDPYGRFDYGIPPAKNGDYAYLLHVIASLKSTGKGAIILPHGVLFRGNSEAEIRKNIIAKGFIKGIIGLPANLFYGTGIPATHHRAG